MQTYTKSLFTWAKVVPGYRVILSPQVNFTQCLYVRFPPGASQVLANDVKASPQSCMSQAGESKCLHEKKLSHLTLQKGWAFLQGDLTTRGKCEMCHVSAHHQGEVKWMQSWLVQGSSGGRVTLLPNCCHHIYIYYIAFFFPIKFRTSLFP